MVEASQNQTFGRQIPNQDYSEAKLKDLIVWFHDVQFLTEFNHIYIVEKVRNLSEFLVYGEKRGDSSHFEMFIEENVL